MRKTFLSLIGFTIPLSIIATPSEALPISGQIFEFANNGHFYTWIDDPLTWSEANVAAETFSMEIDGLIFNDWHLATITSQEENDFIAEVVLGLPNAYVGPIGEDRAWIGLFNEFDANNFEWVTGETTDFTNWFPGEPNNRLGTVGTLGRYSNGQWNDEFDTEGNGGFGNRPYLLEHSSDGSVSVMEPSTSFLLGFSLTCLLITKHRTMRS
jgi:hypothetical protein